MCSPCCYGRVDDIIRHEVSVLLYSCSLIFDGLFVVRNDVYNPCFHFFKAMVPFDLEYLGSMH
jgi:hypothetical protein